MKTPKKLSPGAMLARKLSGDKSITNADINKATVDYFEAHGCHCTIETVTFDQKEQKTNSENNNTGKD
jgi:hypothetical protein